MAREEFIMEKTETLKDGTKVTIRNLTIEDLDRLMSFYRSLSEEDMKYLRVARRSRLTSYSITSMA